ncbi:MAG: lipid-A-disaccharide synthase [Candidatus Zixiibacteriota bacterium]|nr:MAG: lipid-A-disaccharide synthase [candidate division Zixibacteria bacterium]
MKQSILIIAGEASGDNAGGLLCEEIKKLQPDLELFGLGGDRMTQAGVNLLYHINRLAFLGFWEVVRHIPFIRSVERDLLLATDNRKPALAILIDYPGFNLRFARKLKARGIPIIYYVSPQVWAWGRKRIGKIKSLVDKMIVVFEFEKELYSREGMEVEWHGHPLLDIAGPMMDRAEFFRKAGLPESRNFIGLFPGSRLQEVARILPVMRDTVMAIRSSGMDLIGIVGSVSGIEDSVYREITGNNFPLMKNMTYDIMANADLNLVASGTATLECAILGKPLFVLYKTSPLTYVIAKILIKISNIALVNVVAGKRIVPEFIQSRCGADNIAAEISDYFSNEGYRVKMSADLENVHSKLGEAGASRKAAESVLKMMFDAKN